MTLMALLQSHLCPKAIEPQREAGGLSSPKMKRRVTLRDPSRAAVA